MVLEAQGSRTAAESSYVRAIAVQPDYVYARVNLGRLYGLEGRGREAVTILEEARRIDPNRIDVLTNLGNAWWMLGDTTRAAAAFERAIAIVPGPSQAAANLAEMRGLPPPP
jgi:Flp pilus assembly protein TadD